MEGQQFEHMGHHQNLSVHHSCTKFAIVSENVKFSWLRCVGLTKQVAEVTQLSQEDLCARMCAGKDPVARIVCVAFRGSMCQRIT